MIRSVRFSRLQEKERELDDGRTYQRAGLSVRGKGAFTFSHLSLTCRNRSGSACTKLYWLQAHYQNNIFHLLHRLPLLSLAFSSLPKIMHILTGPMCKVVIVGLRDTRVIPCIPIQPRLQHGGLILKKRASAKSFSLFALLRSAPLPTNSLSYHNCLVYSLNKTSWLKAMYERLQPFFWHN